jgi:tryptophan halogenase
MVGQRVTPQNYHHMGALLGDERLRRALDSLKTNIERGVEAMSEHKDFLQRYCVDEG